MSGIGFHGAPTGFTIASVIIVIAVISFFGYVIVKLITTREKDSNSPIQAVVAVVVGKRGEVSGIDHTYTRYYATFQFENGDRMELKVKGPEYGMLVENDRGTLTYQGSRFLSFERERANP